MKLETPLVTIFKSNQETFDFLTDLNNFEKLMPDNKEKFEVDGDSFIFGLTGMPEIRLILKEKTAPNKIVLGAASSKLDFTLTIELKAISENSTSAQLFFNGNFNPMMAMMVKKPLTNFINALSNNLQNI
ncbi:orotate phosphoribosyltransferase [Wenyingzhuangia fucanilytica]|uniref:Orotate phosphoribosyltransferase n=1 Tax=Wenyingzhuangia fucanilytica TaxID=1790137 RepID=A0A1B1Y3F1_9FLAO|nr:orotate phosphoribosyltransferase [Wenyingzhuangia fucanilytica]ANW95259.1 orotate phosphoribosyltransferase [Wenyingzhuangia fucanilytica]